MSIVLYFITLFLSFLCGWWYAGIVAHKMLIDEIDSSKEEFDELPKDSTNWTSLQLMKALQIKGRLQVHEWLRENKFPDFFYFIRPLLRRRNEKA